MATELRVWIELRLMLCKFIKGLLKEIKVEILLRGDCKCSLWMIPHTEVKQVFREVKRCDALAILKKSELLVDVVS